MSNNNESKQQGYPPNQDDLQIKIGNKTVPFSKISKPHTVLINPDHHRPQVDPKDVPDLEPDYKEKAQELNKKNE